MDIGQAGSQILLFTRVKTFIDYEQDSMLQAAVERKFEIIGEAFTQIARLFPQQIDEFTHYRRYIGFRNLLIHRYSAVASEIVWGTIETDLPILLTEVTHLLERFNQGADLTA